MQKQEGKSGISTSDDQYRQALRNFANIGQFESLQSEADEELQDDALLRDSVSNTYLQ